MFARLLLLAALLLPTFALAQVRRAEVMSTAETYVHLPWKPTEQNALHGPDADGIRVDTPDIAFTAPGIRAGWWLPGKTNRGMPYKWGGFDTPAQFLKAVSRGAYAGDVYTAAKRRAGDSAVSQHAAGIDCSGFISRCWGLRRAYSTKELPALCVPLASYRDLMPGDILNVSEKHVLLFREFADARKTRLIAYEAGSPPTWRVLLNSIPLTLLRAEGYVPLRYKQIID